MKRARARLPTPGRHAIAVRLRALAAALALLLSGGTLAQAAHFLVVPHAICAEHGELIEVGQSDHGGHVADGTTHRTRASTPDGSSPEHDHCEVLARSEREQLALTAGPIEVATSPCVARSAAAPPVTASAPATSALADAPKTSPPGAPA